MDATITLGGAASVGGRRSAFRGAQIIPTRIDNFLLRPSPCFLPDEWLHRFSSAFPRVFATARVTQSPPAWLRFAIGDGAEI